MGRSARGPHAYRRRIERLRAKGLSVAAARGHAKYGEPAASAPRWPDDERLTQAVAHLVAGRSISDVAKSLGISRERLRRAADARGSFARVGRRQVFAADRGSDLPLYSNGRSIRVVVDRQNASRLGAYMAAVGRYLETNRKEWLQPFIGEGLVDVAGRYHPFETDPEELYILNAKGRPDCRIHYQSVAPGA